MDPLKAYSDELAHAYPQRGYPMANPQPGARVVDGIPHFLSPIEVGDVGYISHIHGKFIRMFNVHREAGVHGQPRLLDLPDDFEPMPRTPLDYNEHRTPIWKSQSVVARSLSADASGSSAGASAGFSSTTERGAVLYTPDAIECHDALHIGLYKQYAKANIERWHKFAVQDLDLEIQIEDLIFVTGVDRTTSWATAVFTKGSLDVNFGINVQYANVAGVQLAANFSWQHAQDVWVNSGPTQSQTFLTARDSNAVVDNDALLSPLNTIRNQSLFVRRIRCKRRIWPGIKLVANGQPEDLDKEDDSSDNSQSAIIASSFPAREKFVDNLEPVLDFILEHSSSDIALAHDEDLEQLPLSTGMSSQVITQGTVGILRKPSTEPFHITDSTAGFLQYTSSSSPMLASIPNSDIALMQDEDTNDSLFRPTYDTGLDFINEGNAESFSSWYNDSDLATGLASMGSYPRGPRPISPSTADSSPFNASPAYDHGLDVDLQDSTGKAARLVFPRIREYTSATPPTQLHSMRHHYYLSSASASGSTTSLGYEMQKPAPSAGISMPMFHSPVPPPSKLHMALGRGRMIPHSKYRPHTAADRIRYVNNIDLLPPVHFNTTDPGIVGISLMDAMAGKYQHLDGRDDRLFKECGPSISIRINWAGCYAPWSRQIPTRDFKTLPGPVTRAKVAKNVARSVQRFIEEMSRKPLEDDADPGWAVGTAKNGIVFEDLALVRLEHVSKGSWQAQLCFVHEHITKGGA